MDLRSSTRSRRSKSRTPFATTDSEQVYVEEKYSAVTHSEDIRTSSTVVRSSNGKSSYERLSEELSIKSSATQPSVNRRTRRFSKLYKTSDYSSEDGENEVSSTRSISDNEKNRILEDARKAADNSTGITALGLYRKAKQYWEEYPKTDWTYSPFSKDRVEIAPGVVAMPNMSRRHISSYNKYTNTNTYSASSPSSFLRTRQILETNTFYGVVKKSILRVLISILSIFHLFWRPFSYAFRFIHSVCITVAKGIYLGTSAIMLLDTWLLRSNRNYGKAAALTALCLIPFLIIGGWWLSLTTRENNWNSMENLFSTDGADQTVIINSKNIRTNEQTYKNLHQDSSGYSLTERQLDEILQYIKASLNTNNDIDYQEITKNIMNTEIIQNLMNEYKENHLISNKQANIEDLVENQRKSIEALTNELSQLKTEISNLQNHQANLNERNMKIHTESSQKMDYFMYQLNRCCKKAVNLESHILKTLIADLNNPNFLQNQKGLTNWLNSLFVAKTELENQISQLSEQLKSNFESLLQSNSKFLMDQVRTKLNFEFNLKHTEGQVSQGSPSVNISEHTVRQIVRDTLKIYDADKTGLVDYAMEAMGAQVITTRCTESYHAGTAVVSVFGLPLWYLTASPRTVITPGINPGKCWAFQNFPGLIVIKLMAPIRIEAFSYEHVSRLLVPDGKIDSAPRDIEFYGLEDENDKNGVKIGSYRYDYNGESLQFFPSQNSDSVFQYVEIRIISNHGNPNYTCLYRFRVHGNKIMS
ncbi:sun domain-containing protein 1-like isoform X1 [Coccinella septempunctata]|uniref:sun domain-containing protein 1-like isoform X1 n=1 Tax=Coccinella septempunctata TaxID=41139 RepID=UPI001D0631FB|nr:sun domain-containing protein 1-like isoform X1 [Coccinella septempunctata]